MPEYEKAGTDFDFTDASHQAGAAQALYRYIQREGAEGEEGTTDETGALGFPNLEKGVYLLAQPQRADLEGGKYQSAPVLICIPTVEEYENEWAVMIEPKFENESLPVGVSENRNPPQSTSIPKPTFTTRIEGVETGDTIQILGWTVLAAAALTAIRLVLGRHRVQKI